MAQLEITLKKSLIGERREKRETIKTLGLKKIGQTVVRQDNAATRGALRSVAHMVEVKEVD